MIYRLEVLDKKENCWHLAESYDSYLDAYDDLLLYEELYSLSVRIVIVLEESDVK